MDNVKNVIDSGAPFVDLHLAVAPAQQLLVGWRRTKKKVLGTLDQGIRLIYILFL